MMKVKNHDGFTLIEVIISIAILSVVSVVVLQLFMTSRNLNIQSRHSDIASVLTSNTIESVKSFDNPIELLETMDWLQSGNHAMNGVLNFDDDFQQIDHESRFQLFCKLEEDMANPGLYAVSVMFTDLSDDRELASYSTKHYFKHQEVAND